MSPYHNNSLREDNALAVFGLLSVDFLHGEKPDVVTEQVSLLWWQKAFSSYAYWWALLDNTRRLTFKTKGAHVRSFSFKANLKEKIPTMLKRSSKVPRRSFDVVNTVFDNVIKSVLRFHDTEILLNSWQCCAIIFFFFKAFFVISVKFEFKANAH